MRISAFSTTQEILSELGHRLQAYRVQQGRTAEQLGVQAGVAARTVNRVEAGENTSLDILVKLLRALGRLDALDAFLPEPLISPLQLAELRGRPRQRARAPRPNRARVAEAQGTPKPPKPGHG